MTSPALCGEAADVFWCFHCYAVNDHPRGPCAACGQPVESPGGLTWTNGLIWTLRHPDADRALLAARTLGRLRARESVPALRAAAETGPDVYLRAEALRSLIAIEGTELLRPWLEGLCRDAPFMVRDIAREALAGSPPDSDPA
ncbi:MAG TPA: HEAT repeat domain-containing protein [Trebonia sp.]